MIIYRFLTRFFLSPFEILEKSFFKETNQYIEKIDSEINNLKSNS